MDPLTALAAEPLDPSLAKPLYQQLKERILQVVATRALNETTPLPTEESIARALGLSRGTVRRCFADLVREGHVIRKRGRGTFVVYQRQSHTLETSFNFTAEISALGKVPSSKVLRLGRVKARAGISRRLDVPDGTEVWEIRRVRYADGKPLQYVVAYVPVAVCPKIDEKALESSLYTLIAEASGRMPARAVEVYEAINLDAREASVLELSPGMAALRTLRTTFDAHGRPFEASVIILRADRNRFQLTLDTHGTTMSKITT
ncbi:GntR family transcriptional regulator [Olsenella massiliensis]|uniref:GntR family transcriptional regulator n=1 Tax=Olsenella massiliensis TaxID=1622075 RepID=UPI00071E0108|nr:GntR family transcriptional regulator [Olsenella massiliensis]